jgi:hypothetical protein
MGYSIDIVNKHTKRTVRIGDSCFNEIDISSFDDYGSTICIDGTDTLSTNITYNYAPFFEKVFGENGIRSIYGISFNEAVRKLQHAEQIFSSADKTDIKWVLKYEEPTEDEKKRIEQILHCKWERPSGYWECTVDNCLKAVRHLLFLSEIMKKLVTASGLSIDDYEFSGD